MTTAFIRSTPSKSAAIYVAATIIEKCGPMQRAELFAAMSFGPPENRERKLREAFKTDWLRETPDGHLELTDYSRRQIEREKPKKKFVGEKAAPAQWNVFASPGLSKKNIPNSHGMRQDIPGWSRRSAGFSMKNVGGGEL